MTFLDRIKETSTSTGTSTFTLGGAVLGYKVFTNGTYKYCIVNETESEWEVGEGTVASGVLTRTTIEASSNGGAAVSFSAGTKFVFNTVSAAYVNSLVPYTGATAAVNLGAYGITSDYLQLSTTPTATGAVGRMIWNDTDGTMDIGLKGGNVTLQVGQEEVVRVVNKVGATLLEANYQAVYISGAQGQRPKVALALGNSDATSASTIGLVTETIADNQEGFITTSGIVRGINTTGSLQGETWADGQILYLSPTTAGRITNIKPTAPNHTVVIGYVIHAHATQGKIFVKVDNGYELTELHDIYAPSPTNGQSIYWNATNSRYELNTIAGVLGYTPQAAITLTTTGSSGASTFVSNTLNIPTYTLAGLGGISLTSLSASAPLSYNNTTGVFFMAQATSSVNGYLSSTDWTTFNNKQGAITLTTTGTSGAATLVGNTLNIPQYAAGITGSGTAGQVTYWSGTSSVTGNSNLFWDNTNGRLGIGTSSPLQPLHIVSSDCIIITRNTSTTGYSGMNMFDDTNTLTGSFAIGGTATGTLAGNMILGARKTNGNLLFVRGASATVSAALFGSTGNLLIQNGGTFTDGGQRLQVIGSMRVGTTAASAMYWDDTNNRLGIGTSSPASKLNVINTTASEYIATFRASGTPNPAINIEDGDITIPNYSAVGFNPSLTSNSVGLISSSNGTAGGLAFSGFTNTTGGNPLYFQGFSGKTTGNTGAIVTFLAAKHNGTTNATLLSSSEIPFEFVNWSSTLLRIYGNGNTILQNGGTFTDAGYRLDVQGTMRATGQVRLSGLPTSSAGLSAGDLWNNLGIVSIV